jgi:hypothetical protein
MTTRITVFGAGILKPEASRNHLKSKIGTAHAWNRNEWGRATNPCMQQKWAECNKKRAKYEIKKHTLLNRACSSVAVENLKRI